MSFSFSCASTENQSNNNPNLRNLKDYSQYTNMLEVLQSVGRLRVRGGKVFMEGYNTTNATNEEPLYVIDGVVVGNSLSNLDRLIQPVQVSSVRTLRGMQASSRYGDQGRFGVVLITTINKR